MTGLRARQKRDRNRRILDAATGLFRNLGYDSTRIEDIAEQAEISVGTFYNYFENKGDILLAVVTMEVEEVLEAGEAIVRNPPLPVEEAFGRMINQYFDHSLVYLSKEMWRTAMAIAIQQPESPFSRRYTDLDKRLSTQVATLAQTLQMRGAIKTGIDVIAVGEMIFNNLNMMFVEFAKDDSMSLNFLKNQVARQNLPLAKLISA